ncbi:MAG: FeoB-associated Cys-rich membrane protein [Agriterribacter sp.]|jgi:heme exporter protein D
MNTTIVIIVGIVALALIVFVTVKNVKDRKKVLPPDSTDDKVLEARMNKEHRRKQL